MGLNKPKQFEFDGNEGDHARKYIDLLLPFMKEAGGFTIYDTINNSDLSDDDKGKARQLYYHIRITLTSQLGYAKDHPHIDSDILLTQKGINERKIILEIKNLDKVLDYFYKIEKQILPFNIVGELKMEERDVYSYVVEIHRDGYFDKISTGDAAFPRNNIYIINRKGKLFKLDGGYKGAYERKEQQIFGRLDLASINVEKQKDEEIIRKLTIDNLQYEKDNRVLKQLAEEKDNDLKDLQIAELKTKRIWAFFAAIGGAGLTFLIDHIKYFLKLFHISH